MQWFLGTSTGGSVARTSFSATGSEANAMEKEKTIHSAAAASAFW
jgi:hypothetical protein